MSVYLATVGDANDERIGSGTPYHCLQTGRAAGIIDAGLPLSAEGSRWALRRLAWNLKEFVQTGERGGYQFTESFLARLWRNAGQLTPGDVIISWFPLLPEWLRTDPKIEKWFFIDQTLSQLFFYYRLAGSVSRRTMEDALARERLNYTSAKGIITESKWAANSVANEYGVPDEKIHVVLPGASLDRLAYERWAASGQVMAGRKPTGALSLVFVGKYWGRKGLDRLLDAFAIARSHGAAVSLKIIGFPREQAPSKYRMLQGVRWLGGIDKRTAAERFMNELSECDVGCLLSRQEAGGIALREYHALGLAALAPETGGSPEYVLAEAAILVPPDMEAAGIASIISELAQNPEKVAAMKRAAWARRREFTWDQTIPAIGRILNAGAERAKT